MELEAQEVTLYRVRDQHGEIRVAERGLIRFLFFDQGTQQSATLRGHPYALILHYAQAMSMVLLFHPAPKRVLVIGLGGGSLVNFLFTLFPNTQIDVIELRPDVVDVAHTYFDVPRHHPRINITIADAHDFLRPHAAGTWDIILSDAFDADGPAHGMDSKAHARNVRRALSANGVACFNLWNRLEDDFPNAAQSISKAFLGRTIQYTLGSENSNAMILGFSDAIVDFSDPRYYNRAQKFRQKTGIDYPDLLEKMIRMNAPFT